MEFLDAYTIRARLYPAILAIAPAIALLALTIALNSFALPQLVVTAAIGVLFVTFSDLARRFGKRAERRLFADNGGYPINRLLHRSDTTWDEATKDHYRKKLEKLFGHKAPTAAEERKNPGAANAYYKRALAWVRENTRDHSEFKILFEENVTYGFRRNLYGIKWPALVLNAATVLTCLGLLYVRHFPASDTGAMIMIAIVAALHAVLFLFGVTRAGVLDASNQYARQLVLSVESISAKPVKAS